MKLNKIIYTAVLAGLLSGIPTTANAAEREITMNVKEENLTGGADSGVFFFVLEDYEGVTATLTDPSGKNTYTGTYNELNDRLECVVNTKISSGTWKAVISDGKEDTEEDSGAEMTEEDGSEDDRIKILEKGVDINQSLTMDAENAEIKVSSDISGLAMYFKDDDFVAEWTDSSVGDVNIEIENTQNREIIASEKVSQSYYEVAIPEDVKEITVSLVPSVSQNVEGAKNSYTFPVDNHPDATVTYEDISITNRDTINVTIVTEDTYGIDFYDNNKEFDSVALQPAGTYTYEIPTEVGDNDYLIYIVDKDGNMRSTAGYTFKDIVAPSLQLKNSYVDISTYDEIITLEGEVKDYDYFTINDKDVPVEGDWTFSYDYELKEGLNNIIIKASDKAGNVTEYDATVTRLVEVEEPIPWAKILMIAGIVLLVGVYIAFAIIKKKKDSDDKGEKQVKTKSKNNNKKEKKEKKEKEKKKINAFSAKENIITIVEALIPVLVIFLLFKFIICVGVVQSESMEPTLMTGNTVFYNRLAYIAHEPQRGDIVIFWSDERNEYMGKRIIGIPGDEIEFVDGQVMINGYFACETDYLGSDVETNCLKTFTVPDGCYFMLGDNRMGSLDSRYWENPYIEKKDLVGKYMGQIDFSFQSDIMHKL